MQLSDTAKIINRSSFLIFEVGLNNHPQKVHNIFSNLGYTGIELIKDYNGDDRVMAIQL